MIEPKDVRKIHNLPLEIKFCKRCTMSNQRPRIVFDEEGVCSACRFTEKKENEIDWDEREKELIELCDRHRRKDGSHDVVVPSSGGKDSTFTAYQLKYKYGMNPLTVTWAPHLYTDIGWKNYQNFIIKGGFDNTMFMPDGKVNSKLCKFTFEKLGDPFKPFEYGASCFPLQVSVKYKIPLIMYGENSEVEYGGGKKNEDSPTRDYIKDYNEHVFHSLPPEALVEHGFSKKDINSYLRPPIEELERNRTESHMLGYYINWVPQENYYLAVEKTGFTANPERSEGTYSKYASLDDKTDGFHYYMMFIKFGIGRATSDSAHEIRDGHLTREEGVHLVQKYDGEFPEKYFKTFLEYCEITEEYFWKVVDSWRTPHLWENINGKWKLKHQIS